MEAQEGLRAFSGETSSCMGSKASAEEATEPRGITSHHVEVSRISMTAPPRSASLRWARGMGCKTNLGPFPPRRKIAFMNALSRTGVTEIEAGSFVSPKAVPQHGRFGRCLPQDRTGAGRHVFGSCAE